MEDEENPNQTMPLLQGNNKNSLNKKYDSDYEDFQPMNSSVDDFL